MISIREEITIASPPEAVWPLLSDPAVVASCIPGATLTKAGGNGAYQGTMRIKFGPTVAQFRGEAKLAYDHAARRCSIEGRGIDCRRGTPRPRDPHGIRRERCQAHGGAGDRGDRRSRPLC